MPRPTRLLAASLALSVPACLDRSVTEDPPRPENTANLEFNVNPNPDLDLLFVIDNSGSMKNEQDEVLASFPQMIQVLETLPSGLPNLHLGVISTDVGAGSACPAPSTAPGVLRDTPMVASCSPPSDRWISDVTDAGGGRTRNYSGDLADTFSCIASLGTNGCGFEQPLESLRLALSPDNLSNTGFLRPDSLLAVVILSDEDDCSSHDTGFFEAPAGVHVNGDFRCFAQGVDCDNGTPATTAGTRTACTPKDDGPLVPVGDYAQVLQDLRPLSSRLLVAGILGDHDPIRIGTNSDGDLDTLTSCAPDPSNPEGAYAPIRTDAFLHLFDAPIRHRICDHDLTPAIVDIGHRIVEGVYGGCIAGELANPSAPDCAVAEVDHPATSEETSIPLARCDAGQSNAPCWTLETDTHCTSSTEGYRIVTHYPASAAQAADTIIRAQCRLVPGA